MALAPSLEALMDSASTERAILEWLKQEENAWILPFLDTQSWIGVRRGEIFVASAGIVQKIRLADTPA